MFLPSRRSGRCSSRRNTSRCIFNSSKPLWQNSTRRFLISCLNFSQSTESWCPSWVKRNLALAWFAAAWTRASSRNSCSTWRKTLSLALSLCMTAWCSLCWVTSKNFNSTAKECSMQPFSSTGWSSTMKESNELWSFSKNQARKTSWYEDPTLSPSFWSTAWGSSPLWLQTTISRRRCSSFSTTMWRMCQSEVFSTFSTSSSTSKCWII